MWIQPSVQSFHRGGQHCCQMQEMGVRLLRTSWGPGSSAIQNRKPLPDVSLTSCGSHTVINAPRTGSIKAWQGR
jgi:hypothetical protein